MILSIACSVEADQNIALRSVEDAVTSAVNNNDWLRECVPPFKANSFSNPISYSNYELRQKKHGLCADHLACAFVDCAWTEAAKNVLSTSDLATVDFNSIKGQLPPLNLPAAVAFPTNVRQLVAAVKAGRKSKLGLISVKTSGHSYAGSSTMRNSTQINLRNLTKYSANGIVECQTLCAGSNSNRACALAQARGKKAVIRIGGGEAHDDTYRAVLDWNANTNHANKYTIIGGGAGTVSAAGGWLQGGGLSTGLERQYGFGVDQVLEIEMVLADGTHIKFGPTKWVTQKGYIYPRTTKVEGFCNSNLVDDESKWKWTACKKSIPFSDLWFAVRGGGGGTYGIVTAIQVQLHPYYPLNVVSIDTTAYSSIVPFCGQVDCSALQNAVYDFLIDLFYNPKGINLSEQASNACGSPGFTFSFTGTVFGASFSSFWCDGSQATNAVIGAWKNYVTTVILPKFPIFAPLSGNLLNFFTFAETGSYAEMVIQRGPSPNNVPIGHIQDNPPPETQSLGTDAPLWSANVPIKWLIQKNDQVHNFLANHASSCHLIGGLTNVAHDQMTAINPFQRVSGLQCMIYGGLEQHYRAQFLPYFKTKAGKFPGGTEYNHIHPSIVGPLKANWTQPCPLTYTREQQQQQCVSLVESVWGTDILSQLQKIKKAVDPTSSFNCHFCVGEASVQPCK